MFSKSIDAYKTDMLSIKKIWAAYVNLSEYQIRSVIAMGLWLSLIVLQRLGQGEFEREQTSKFNEMISG